MRYVRHCTYHMRNKQEEQKTQNAQMLKTNITPTERSSLLGFNEFNWKTRRNAQQLPPVKTLNNAVR